MDLPVDLGLGLGSGQGVYFDVCLGKSFGHRPRISFRDGALCLTAGGAFLSLSISAAKGPLA